MERFRPDNWLEGVLRPFLMMDPLGWIYFEGLAPDWRFGLAALFLLLWLLAWRHRARASGLQVQLAIGLAGSMLLWTFVIGNGRYFMTGLLLIGPLVVAAWRLAPGSVNLRCTMLPAALALQAAVVASTFRFDHWGHVQWEGRDAIDIESSPLRQQPAVFLTPTSISYSILVPRFHADARWANVVGQYDITPGTREYPALAQMLDAPLPKYVLWPIGLRVGDASLQPDAQVRRTLQHSLQALGVVLQPEPCVTLRSRLAPGPRGPERSLQAQDGMIRGFWFCPVRVDAALRQGTALPTEALRADIAAALAAVEARCPRFFSPGTGKQRPGEFPVMRHYPTDMALVVDDRDLVLMRYHRAVNYTPLGTVTELRNGQFALSCDKLPGRYVPPWARH